MRISIAAKTTELCDWLTCCLGEISPDLQVETWDDPAALLHRSNYADWDIVMIEASGSDFSNGSSSGSAIRSIHDSSQDSTSDAAIKLAARISALSPHTGVIIIAQDYRYAPDALRAHVQSYLTVPVSREQILGEYNYYLERQSAFRQAHEVSNPSGDASEHTTGDPSAHTIEINENNGFDCYVDGVPVRFNRSKSRDVMEYLVSKKGAMVEDKELLDALWGNENASAKSSLRSSKAEIVSLFRDAGCEDAIVKHRGRIGIMMDKLA